MGRKGLFVHFLKYYLVLLVLFVAILNSNVSVAISNVEAEREANLSIASKYNAFIGITSKDKYIIEKGDKLNFYVTNNFPFPIECYLYLDGDIIYKYNPDKSFELKPYGDKKKIQIKTDKEVEPGLYQIDGIVSTVFDEGSSDVEIAFEVEVKEPLPMITPPVTDIFPPGSEIDKDKDTSEEKKSTDDNIVESKDIPKDEAHELDADDEDGGDAAKSDMQ